MKKKTGNPLGATCFGILVLGAFIGVTVGCGVKGPPLPPVADTPQASDRGEAQIAPAPSPTPSPAPRTKSKKKR